MKKNNNFLSNKLVKYFVIPLLLLALWYFGSIILINKLSYSVLEYKNGEASLSGKKDAKLLKDNTVTGEFIAKENNIGIVFVKFNNFVKPDFRGEDVLTFKLKEKNANEWYYVNNYRSGSLEHQLSYPFGFPPISSSKGKVYQFEIISLFGNKTNAVELSKSNPVISTAYQFSRQEIAGSKKRLVVYIIKKSINSFTNIDFLFSSVLFLLPFIFYVVWQLVMKKHTTTNKLMVALVATFAAADVLFVKVVYSGVILGLLVAWVVALRIYKLKSTTTLLVCFSLIVVWVIISYFGFTIFSEKINIWVYSLFIIGIVQLLIEEKHIK